MAPQPPCRKSSNEPLYEPVQEDPVSHGNAIYNEVTDSNSNSPVLQAVKSTEKCVKNTPSNGSGNNQKPNPPPVDAIAIVSNNSKESSKSKCNTSNGNEIAPRIQAVNVQESRQGKGIRVTRSVENHCDSRKSSVSSAGGSMFSKCRTGSVADPTSEQIRTEARGLVEVVRELTGLSHTVSQVSYSLVH